MSVSCVHLQSVETMKERRQRRIAAIVGLTPMLPTTGVTGDKNGANQPAVQFGLLHCMACNTMPCSWSPFKRADLLEVCVPLSGCLVVWLSGYGVSLFPYPLHRIE